MSENREGVLLVLVLSFVAAVIIGLPWLLGRLQSLGQLWADVLGWVLLVGLFVLLVLWLAADIRDEVTYA